MKVDQPFLYHTSHCHACLLCFQAGAQGQNATSTYIAASPPHTATVCGTCTALNTDMYSKDVQVATVWAVAGVSPAQKCLEPSHTPYPDTFGHKLQLLHLCSGGLDSN